MTEGSIYPCMDDFRLVVRHHVIIGEFKLGIEKSDTNRFRGYCAAEECPWAIVARLMDDGKSMRVTRNRHAHDCTSTGRILTKVATKHWVAEKVAPILKKRPNLGAKELKESWKRSTHFLCHMQLYGLEGRWLQRSFLEHGKRVLKCCIGLRQRLSSGAQEVL